MSPLFSFKTAFATPCWSSRKSVCRRGRRCVASYRVCCCEVPWTIALCFEHDLIRQRDPTSLPSFHPCPSPSLSSFCAPPRCPDPPYYNLGLLRRTEAAQGAGDLPQQGGCARGALGFPILQDLPSGDFFLLWFDKHNPRGFWFARSRLSIESWLHPVFTLLPPSLSPSLSLSLSLSLCDGRVASRRVSDCVV